MFERKLPWDRPWDRKENKMIKISDRITIDGFNNQNEFEKWLDEQFDNIPNSELLRHFKWFLMKLEEDSKENINNKQHCDAVDKYAVKVIERQIMKEAMVIKFISDARKD